MEHANTHSVAFPDHQNEKKNQIGAQLLISCFQAGLKCKHRVGHDVDNLIL